MLLQELLFLEPHFMLCSLLVFYLVCSIAIEAL